MKKIIILSLLSMMLVGCATTNETNMPVQSEGKPVGPGLSSPQVNALMDASDRAKVRQLVTTGTKQQHEKWQSAKNGTEFTFTSLNIFVNDEGAPCRDYKISSVQKGFLSNKELQVNATACRQAEGSWKLTSSHDVPH